MSFHEYQASRELVKADPPFYALIMAAMAKADTPNLMRLQQAWPTVWAEAQARYNAPGARLEGD